jgi:uncharacterized membrane protein YtjA (UPF0391 family)
LGDRVIRRLPAQLSLDAIGRVRAANAFLAGFPCVPSTCNPMGIPVAVGWLQALRPTGRRARRLKETVMLYYAALFFVIALVAALFGFGGIAAGAAEIAKVLFFIFLVLFVVSLIAGTLRRGP